MSLRPVTAPPGSPPARIFASVVRSGLMPIGRLRPARRHAEAVDHLVEDQQHAVLGGQPAQRVEEIGVDRQAAAIGAGRLDDRGGDLAVVLLQQPRQHRLVVLVAQQHVAGHRIEHAGRRGAVEMARMAGGHVVVPAVEMIVEADDLGLAAEGAGEPHRHQRRLGAGAGEAHPLGGRDQPLDQLGPVRSPARGRRRNGCRGRAGHAPPPSPAGLQCPSSIAPCPPK